MIAGPNGATLLSMLLKRMTLWMAHAAAYLQRCHHAAQQESANTAYMEGLGAGQALDNIAQARQAVRCLGSLAYLSCLNECVEHALL